MEFEKVKIPATDGYELSAHVFESPAETKGSVVIGSATGANKGYYKSFAKYLKENGYHTVTFDYRGIGESLHGDIKAFIFSVLAVDDFKSKNINILPSSTGSCSRRR